MRTSGFQTHHPTPPQHPDNHKTLTLTKTIQCPALSHRQRKRDTDAYTFSNLPTKIERVVVNVCVIVQ